MLRKLYGLGFISARFICIFLASWFVLSAVALADFYKTPAVWYNATQGGTPDSQGMFYQEANGLSPIADAEQTYQDGATVLTTTITIGDYAGYGIAPGNAPTLIANDGFKLIFRVQVVDEIHLKNRPERSGFSVILLDNNAKGIELGFHENAIYAREGNGPLFQYAEDVIFDTTQQTLYELRIFNTTYTLSVNGSVILSGSVRDYSDNEPPLPIIPDPYEQTNFIFLGDNTTSASAIVKLWYVATAIVDPNIIHISSFE